MLTFSNKSFNGNGIRLSSHHITSNVQTKQQIETVFLRRKNARFVFDKRFTIQRYSMLCIRIASFTTLEWRLKISLAITIAGWQGQDESRGVTNIKATVVVKSVTAVKQVISFYVVQNIMDVQMYGRLTKDIQTRLRSANPGVRS